MKKANPLNEGDDAPPFTYRDTNGLECATNDLKGSPYLVYFYPRDNTPGCTTEACGFRDHHSELNELGLTVIGVSCDSEKSHEKFRKKHALPFPLAADESKKIVQAFGVWGEKTFMGRKFEGIHRMSFIIGANGKIAKAYHKVKSKIHPDEVLSVVREQFG
ncbi:MAG: thioredoxin-dependent thiol peroxidase [Opitutales bacterium]|jgi:thioredoxin-dependent peroxiredoxin